MKYLKAKKGFTLIELIVVIAILAIIAAVAIPTTISYVASAERSKASTNANTVARQIQNNLLEIKGSENYTDVNLVKILNQFCANSGDEVVGVTVTIEGVITVYTNVDYADDTDYTAVEDTNDYFDLREDGQVVGCVVDTNTQLDLVDGPIKAMYVDGEWIDA